MCIAQYLFALYSFHNSFHLVLSQTAKREFKFSLYFIVRDRFDQNWTTRERQRVKAQQSLACAYTEGKIFSVFTEIGPSANRAVLDPPRARESPLKGGRRSRRSKFRGGAFCPRDALHLLSFCQRSPFLLRSSFSSLFRLSLSLPELSTREDGGKRIIPVLSLSLPFCPLRSSRSTSEPTIRSLASLVLSRDPLTDRRSSSVARADSSHRTSINLSSKLGYQSQKYRCEKRERAHNVLTSLTARRNLLLSRRIIVQQSFSSLFNCSIMIARCENCQIYEY